MQHSSIAMAVNGIPPLTDQSSSLGGLAVLAGRISAAIDLGGAETGVHIVTALRDAVADAELLSRQTCPASATRYARHVIHADPSGRFTILAIVWEPGQASPIHAHHTWCAYAMNSGVLTETVYRLERSTLTAQPLYALQRRPGYGCYSEAGLDEIHRLENSHDTTAVSIHVYGVDQTAIGSGVNRIVEASR